jgi:hypothetical protein
MMGDHSDTVQQLATSWALGELLQRLAGEFGGFELLAHWTQGEFHHDLVLAVSQETFPGPFLVVSTNCNGGVKEVLCVETMPDRWALWNQRCPDNPEFTGELGAVLDCARTPHWFDPCRLLEDDARSELRPECRQRQRGGGWIPVTFDEEC